MFIATIIGEIKMYNALVYSQQRCFSYVAISQSINLPLTVSISGVRSIIKCYLKTAKIIHIMQIFTDGKLDRVTT